MSGRPGRCCGALRPRVRQHLGRRSARPRNSSSREGCLLSETTRLSHIVCRLLLVKKNSVSDGLALATTENWDSITHMELIAAIEQEFAIELSVDDIVAMVSYAAIRTVLVGKGLAV